MGPILTTDYQSAYWANALTLRGSAGSLDSLSRSIADARVDLNPHQVDAALFAVRSPLSKGVILADEVGLGKTIEAGLVIAQRWAERRRKLLLILPATLRKQWQQEMQEKFSLPTVILESKTFNALRREGQMNPFDQKDRIVICSYHFASTKMFEVNQVPWSLVVIDEAHRLRNVYKPSNQIAANIARALRPVPKILLTATPLQNSLLELYGLVSVIDEHTFGDLDSFREQFLRLSNEDERNSRLRERLRPFCTRTLRKQVLEYIRFTQRVPITQDFLPSDAEHQLYGQISAYLQRNQLYALPPSQRNLLTLVLRKLLASSTFAIAASLRRIIARLEKLKLEAEAEQNLEEPDFETFDELRDEWDDDEAKPKQVVDPKLLAEEITELRHYADHAESIARNSKGEALITVLRTALEKAEGLGAARKAVIFTESRRTQDYLLRLLSDNGYAGQIVIINGTNSDPQSRATYEAWAKRHAGTDALSGSRSSDTKAALVEEFRDRGTLLIATESAAEGVNLQFCSLVVNYDLPWNPQRIEQRIGRCHRYGQKHDVVVVNFLNRRNEADQRVFQLLSEKFRLFDGVFGSSDEVLGTLESGIDFERRIAQVYQDCRTAEEIQTSFDALQHELEEKIAAQLDQTRRALFENFDEEVHARLRVHRDRAQEVLSLRQRWLFSLTRHELKEAAAFQDGEPAFELRGAPAGVAAPAGRYHLDWRAAEAQGGIFYRLEHPLAEALVERAKSRVLPSVTLVFDYASHGAMVSALEPLRGQAGWLQVMRLVVDSLDREEFLVFAAVADSGASLDPEVCEKLLALPATVSPAPLPPAPEAALAALHETRRSGVFAQVERQNSAHFDEEVTKLDGWADDLKFGLEKEIREVDREIREARRASAACVALAEKLASQRRIRDLEAKRNQKRRDLYEAQDGIDRQREALIQQIERQLKFQTHEKRLFLVRWQLSGTGNGR